jgi:hypothetical protein
VVAGVTTQMRPKIEPKLSVQLLSPTQPNPTKVAAPIQGSASNTGKDRTEIRKQIRVDPFSLQRAPWRAIPASCRPFLSTVTPCTLLTPRRWLPGGQGRYSGIRALSIPGVGAASGAVAAAAFIAATATHLSGRRARRTRAARDVSPSGGGLPPLHADRAQASLPRGG